MLSTEIQESIKECVLCWLATVDSDGAPNVSTKEMFVSDGNDQILIANIASPNSTKNIESNNNVCVSFIDIFKQKGFKVKGTATIIGESAASYHSKLKLLQSLGGEGFR
ncbi:MAG: pyridoxamine 5'-phosphate oxidase family protein [Candidatus Thiodiazotropha sp.]